MTSCACASVSCSSCTEAGARRSSTRTSMSRASPTALNSWTGSTKWRSRRYAPTPSSNECDLDPETWSADAAALRADAQSWRRSSTRSATSRRLRKIATKDGQWDFLYVGAPLKVRRGTGAPAQRRRHQISIPGGSPVAGPWRLAISRQHLRSHAMSARAKFRYKRMTEGYGQPKAIRTSETNEALGAETSRESAHESQQDF